MKDRPLILVSLLNDEFPPPCFGFPLAEPQLLSIPLVLVCFGAESSHVSKVALG